MIGKACPHTFQTINVMKKSAITKREEVETKLSFAPCVGTACAIFVAEMDEKGEEKKDEQGNVIGVCSILLTAMSTAKIGQDVDAITSDYFGEDEPENPPANA